MTCSRPTWTLGAGGGCRQGDADLEELGVGAEGREVRPRAAGMSPSGESCEDIAHVPRGAPGEAGAGRLKNTGARPVGAQDRVPFPKRRRGAEAGGSRSDDTREPGLRLSRGRGSQSFRFLAAAPPSSPRAGAAASQQDGVSEPQQEGPAARAPPRGGGCPGSEDGRGPAAAGGGASAGLCNTLCWIE